MALKVIRRAKRGAKDFLKIAEDFSRTYVLFQEEVVHYYEVRTEPRTKSVQLHSFSV